METKSFYKGNIKINTYMHKVKTNDSLGENNITDKWLVALFNKDLFK